MLIALTNFTHSTQMDGRIIIEVMSELVYSQLLWHWTNCPHSTVYRHWQQFLTVKGHVGGGHGTFERYLLCRQLFLPLVTTKEN